MRSVGFTECTRQEEDLTLIGICFVMTLFLHTPVGGTGTPRCKGTKAGEHSAVSHASQVGVRMTDAQLRLGYVRPVLLKSCQIVTALSPQVMN